MLFKSYMEKLNEKLKMKLQKIYFIKYKENAIKIQNSLIKFTKILAQNMLNQGLYNKKQILLKITEFMRNKEKKLRQTKLGLKLILPILAVKFKKFMNFIKLFAKYKENQIKSLTKIIKNIHNKNIKFSFLKIKQITENIKKSKIHKTIAKIILNRISSILQKNWHTFEENTYKIHLRNIKFTDILQKIYKKQNLSDAFQNIRKSQKPKIVKNSQQNYKTCLIIISKILISKIRISFEKLKTQINLKAIFSNKQQEISEIVKQTTNLTLKRESILKISTFIQKSLKRFFLILSKHRKPILHKPKKIEIAHINLIPEPPNFSKFLTKKPVPIECEFPINVKITKLSEARNRKYLSKNHENEFGGQYRTTSYLTNELVPPDNLGFNSRNSNNKNVPQYSIDFSNEIQKIHSARSNIKERKKWKDNNENENNLNKPIRRNSRAISTNGIKPNEEMSDPHEIISANFSKIPNIIENKDNENIPKLNRFNQLTFIKAFSSSFMKYYSQVISEEQNTKTMELMRNKKVKGNMEDPRNSQNLDFDKQFSTFQYEDEYGLKNTELIKKPYITHRVQNLIHENIPQNNSHHKRNVAICKQKTTQPGSYSARGSISTNFKELENHISVNKAFVKEMSNINHEINTKLSDYLSPRFRIPKPEIVFQIAKIKEKSSSRVNSNEVSFA